MIVMFVLFLVVIATVVVVLCMFHFIGNKREKEQQKRGTCFDAEEQRDVCECGLLRPCGECDAFCGNDVFQNAVRSARARANADQSRTLRNAVVSSDV